MALSAADSVAIYARASRKWFGSKARQKTQEQIDRLAKAGDHEGVLIHQQVMAMIETMERPVAATKPGE